MSVVTFEVTDTTRAGVIRQARAVLADYLGHANFRDEEMHVRAEGHTINTSTTAGRSTIVSHFTAQVAYEDRGHNAS